MSLSSTISQRLARSLPSALLSQALLKQDSIPQRPLTPIQQRAQKAILSLVQSNQATLTMLGVSIPDSQLTELVTKFASQCDDESIQQFCNVGITSLKWVLNGSNSQSEEMTGQSLSE